MSRPFSIYIVTNVVTEKWYVGKTGNTVWDRWIDHKSNARRGANGYLYRSMRKYGENQFSVQTVAEVPTEEEANNLERIWIILLGSHKENFGYNLTLGGDGVRANEATKRKIGDGNRGKKRSPEFCAAISARQTGKKLSLEHCKAIGDRHRGVPLSAEHRQKLSDAKQGIYVGEKHPMFGRKHKPESLAQMSLSKKGMKAWNEGLAWSEESRAKMSEGQKKRFEDNPAERVKLSNGSKKLWEDPKYRAKMKAAQDIRYAREREQRLTNVK
jgi:group I intron endonuclease